MHLIYKVLCSSEVLDPMKIGRFILVKSLSLSAHATHLWVLPLNILPVDLGSHGMGLLSDVLCHLGQILLPLHISQHRRVNWHRYSFIWRLRWNMIIPNNCSSSPLTNVPPSINLMKTIIIDVRHAHNTNKSNIRKGTVRSEEGKFFYAPCNIEFRRVVHFTIMT